MIDLLKQVPLQYWLALVIGLIVCINAMFGSRPDLTCIVGTVGFCVVLLVNGLAKWIARVSGGRL